MKAKHLLLAVATFVGMTAVAFAQQPTTYPATLRSSGLTVAPWPFKQTDQITLTVNTTQTYPRTGAASMNGAAEVYIHASANTGVYGPSGMRWDTQTISPGDWRVYPASRKFNAVTGSANTFNLTMTPSTWFPIPAGVNISELCFVLNDGPGSMTREGGAAPAAGTTDAKSDFFVPLGATGTSVASDEFVEAVNVSPNPTSTVAQIGFGMRKVGTTSVRVFNAFGSEVKTLVSNETYPQGYHILVWEGDDNEGKAIASGVYYYRVEVNGTIKTGQVVLNR